MSLKKFNIWFEFNLKEKIFTLAYFKENEDYKKDLVWIVFYIGFKPLALNLLNCGLINPWRGKK